MYPASMKIGIGIIAVALAAGTVIVIENHGTRSSAVLPPQTVHTADWYVAHPDVLKADDARCGGDAASIPQAACQNAATADDRLLSQQLQGAASANAAAAKTPAPNAP
jgi:hypothetical protein